MSSSHDEGPMRFHRNWLAFDAARPTRPRLAFRFVVAVVSILLACAVLSLIAQSR